MHKVEYVALSTIGAPWFNDPERMSNYINDLASFNALVQARSEYREFKPAPLNRVVVNGLWFLDNFGQTSPVRIEASSKEKQKYLEHDIADQFSGTVFSDTHFGEILRTRTDIFTWGHSMGGGQHIPHHDSKCTHCGRAWNMRTSSDAWFDRSKSDTVEISKPEWIGKTLYDVREMVNADELYHGQVLHMRQHTILRTDRFIDLTPLVDRDNQPRNPRGWASSDYDRYYTKIDWNTYIVQEGDEFQFDAWKFIHAECQKEAATAATTHAILQCFSVAGVVVKSQLYTPNGYGSESYRGKWMIVEAGPDYFLIGWRKRVIFIEPQRLSGMTFNAYGVQRHFDNYSALTAHLRQHYNTPEGKLVRITIRSGSAELCMQTSGPVINTVRGIEEYLIKYHKYDFSCNATDTITVVPNPSEIHGEDEDFIIKAGGQPIGFLTSDVIG